MSRSKPNSNQTTDRRSFLRHATLAAASVSLREPFIHASDKAESKLPVIGSGAHRYQCHRDWGMSALPSGASHSGNASHGVTIDEAGLIYITHYGDPGSIFVFDPRADS